MKKKKKKEERKKKRKETGPHGGMAISPKEKKCSTPIQCEIYTLILSATGNCWQACWI